MKTIWRTALIGALLATLCILGGMAEAPAEPAAIEEASAPEVPEEPAAEATPAPFSPSDAPYDGVWQPFEDGFRLYLPRGWSALELTEAQAAAGLFYRAGDETGAMAIAVGYMSAGDLRTVDDLARDFTETGYANVVPRDLNGIPAIGFERPQNGYRGVAFFHPVYPQYALYVYASPLAGPGDGAGETVDAILASIGPLSETEDKVKNN